MLTGIVRVQTLFIVQIESDLFINCQIYFVFAIAVITQILSDLR